LAGIAVKATDKYPWDKWIDGQYHTAELNKDFALSVSRFQVLLHRKAADLGIYCRTEKVKGVFPPTVGFLFMDDKMRLNNEWIRLAGLEVWKEDEEEPQN
jgi:kynureninase